MPTVRLRNRITGNEEGIRPAAGSPQHARRLSDVWVYSGGLAVAGVLVYVFLVQGLPQTWIAFHLPLPALAALFCIAESWRVYIHFRRNAQSFALSEIPLVVGLFF